jgi:serine/threonine protein kinase
MSRVFLAEEARLSRQVVVKVLPPEMSAGVNTERFEREIQLAARLHPAVRPVRHPVRELRARAELHASGRAVRSQRQPEEAADYYGRFLDLYQHADPELQPAVREVRERLGRLAQEPGT